MPRKTPYATQRAKKTPGPKRAVYDCVVVGGGPAGLSAAIYLARYNRTVLVIDAAEGRSTAWERNENYLGFPRGVTARRLRELAAEQATRFGAKFAEGRVTSVQRQPDGSFVTRCGRKQFRSLTLILATGVVDTFPPIDHIEPYVGRSLFWCITCDGWKARDKHILLVGNDDEAATTAMQFLNFTPDVTMITHSDGKVMISAKNRRYLERSGISLVRARIVGVAGRGGKMRLAETSAGDRIPVDMMFSSLGSTPNVELARSLRVKLEGGYIKTSLEQRTNIKRLYAAGDVTKAFAHQIVTAAHEGATAAQAANYDLYRPEQREI